MLDPQLQNAGLSSIQTEWLSLPGNTEHIPFIMDIWGEDHIYSPELANLSLQISIEAWRLGFFDEWDESILDNILSEKLQKEDWKYAEGLKQQLQLQMLLLKEENGEHHPFRRFLEAFSATLPNGFALQHMDTVDGAKVYNQTDRGIYIFKKGWPEGSLVFISTHDGNEIPESVSLVIT